MRIANFSPFFGRNIGLSTLTAPVQALAAFFVPTQSKLCNPRPVVKPADAHQTTFPALASTASSVRKPMRPQISDARVHRLKIVRQFEPGANRSCAGRLVISGRMSDVCAELERLAG